MIRSILGACAAAVVLMTGAAAILIAPERASAQSASLNGDWQGQASGNIVRITQQGGALYVVAVTNNANQGAPMVFQPAGSGRWSFTYPDGNQAVVTLEGGGIRLMTPDGWTDLFVAINRPAAPPPQMAQRSAPPPPAAPVSASIDPAVANAIQQADDAAASALEAALTPPVAQPSPPPPPPAPAPVRAPPPATASAPATFASSQPSTPSAPPTPAASPTRVATPSKAYQEGGDCVIMNDKGVTDSHWQVVSTCKYRVFGAWCYDDDGPFSCAKHMKGGFGPLPVAPTGGSSNSVVSTSPRQGAGYRIVWCDYEDWVKGTCGDLEPWTAGRS